MALRLLALPWLCVSPSAGRAWIEMSKNLSKYSPSSASPSAGRAWIEIRLPYCDYIITWVALRGEGVD